MSAQAPLRPSSVRWVALASAAVLPLVLAPSVQSGNSASWTLAQAQRYLVALSPLSLVDVSQADRPEFLVRVSVRDSKRLRPLGRARVVGGRRAWRRFAFAGQLFDVRRAVPVRMRFVLRVADGDHVIQVRGPPPNRFQPRFPMRTTFYYEWFPEGWTQEGIYPYSRYEPSLGYYNSSNPAVVRRHIASMLYGRFAAATYDWWGQRTNQDARFPLVLSLSRQTPLRWAVYYEAEGYGDPTAAEIHADLVYLRRRYFSHPAYLRIDGRPVVFAYGDGGDTCAVAKRWHDANEGINAYLVLSAFPARDHTAIAPYDPSNPGGVRVAAGDVTGDRGTELLTSPGPAAPPTVKVLRADGSQVLAFPAGDPADTQGISIASGDVDGSGKAEIVTGTDTTGEIRVFAVQNGVVVEKAAFPGGLPGAKVAVGDVDGDRGAEIVAGAGPGAQPTVKVFGPSGRLISSFLAYEPTFTGGVSVAAGDVTGDGRAEIITGTGRAPEYRENEVRIFDATGMQVYPAFSSYTSFGGGISVAAGDVDRDGRGDVITGADANTHVIAWSLDANRPRLLESFLAFQEGLGGLVSVGASDVNSNGSAEILAGAPPGRGGEMRSFYGFADCPDQPDAWHVYSATEYEFALAPWEFGIAPGFDKIGTPYPGVPVVPRDLARWRQQIRNMVASNAPWQLVFTFNEWGEGTAVESAKEWETPSGHGAYLDALHEIP